MPIADFRQPLVGAPRARARGGYGGLRGRRKAPFPPSLDTIETTHGEKHGKKH